MFDLVLQNARIFGNADADTVAVHHGRIAHVGREKRIESRNTIDLHGLTVMPGFIDSHTHLQNLGLSMIRLDLSQTSTREDALDRIRDYTQKSKAKVIVGYGWDETAWGERDYLTDKELDFTERPIMLYRKDMHMAVLNSRAMGICGVSKKGGAFSEESLRKIQWLSKPEDSEVLEALMLAGNRAASEGITGARDIMEFNTMGALNGMNFPVRVFGALYDREYSGHDLSASSWWGIKTFLDGSIGSRSAAHEGWEGENLKFSDEGLKEHLEGFWRTGMPVAMHAIGEVAVSQAVDALSGQKGQMRNSIEHFELVNPDILGKVRGSTVLSSQPNFLQWSGKGGLYENSLGQEWFGKDNPFRIILDAGKNLAFGSDCMPIGPNYGIWHAVNSPHPKQKISLQEAVRAYTEGGAFLLNMECCLGRIEPGYFADMVIQGEGYESGQKHIGEKKPLATIKEGVFTHRTEEFISHS